MWSRVTNIASIVKKLIHIAQASNLDWLTKESPSKGVYQQRCENSFEKHREASFGGKNCTFFAKKLITHSLEILKNILQACSEGFNSHFQKEQFLYLAWIKSY